MWVRPASVWERRVAMGEECTDPGCMEATGSWQREMTKKIIIIVLNCTIFDFGKVSTHNYSERCGNVYTNNDFQCGGAGCLNLCPDTHVLSCPRHAFEISRSKTSQLGPVTHEPSINLQRIV